MLMEGGDISGILEIQMGDGLKPEKQSSNMNHESNGYLARESGLYDGILCSSDSHDQLVQMVLELNFQNDYLKSHFEGLKDLHRESSGSYQQTKAIGQEGGASEDVKELHDRIESLNRELLEEKQTRGAAEAALMHLRASHSEADAKAQELSAKLAEGQILFVSCYLCYMFVQLQFCM